MGDDDPLKMRKALEALAKLDPAILKLAEKKLGELVAERYELYRRPDGELWLIADDKSSIPKDLKRLNDFGRSVVVRNGVGREVSLLEAYKNELPFRVQLNNMSVEDAAAALNHLKKAERAVLRFEKHPTDNVIVVKPAFEMKRESRAPRR